MEMFVVDGADVGCYSSMVEQKFTREKLYYLGEKGRGLVQTIIGRILVVG